MLQIIHEIDLKLKEKIWLVLSGVWKYLDKVELVPTFFVKILKFFNHLCFCILADFTKGKWTLAIALKASILIIGNSNQLREEMQLGSMYWRLPRKLKINLPKLNRYILPWGCFFRQWDVISQSFVIYILRKSQSILKMAVTSEFQIRKKRRVKSMQPCGVCFLKKVVAVHR